MKPYKVSDKFRGRIIAALRKLSFSWGPRNEAKKKAQVAPATFQCEKCGVWIYEGKSQENFLNICLTHPEKRVIMEPSVLDHINPIIPPSVGWSGWDDYISNMFCEANNFQVLCKDCNKTKTESENKLRTKTKRKKK